MATVGLGDQAQRFMRRQVALSVVIAIGMAALFRSWTLLLALVVIQSAGLIVAYVLFRQGQRGSA